MGPPSLLLPGSVCSIACSKHCCHASLASAPGSFNLGLRLPAFLDTPCLPHLCHLCPTHHLWLLVGCARGLTHRAWLYFSTVQELVELMQECMSLEAAGRPTAQQALQRLHELAHGRA